jgi:hypothetical protein
VREAVAYEVFGLLIENMVCYYSFVLWWRVFLAVKVADEGSLGLSRRVSAVLDVLVPTCE